VWDERQVGRTEVSDLDRRSVLGRDGVDGEMCVDETHLVEESLDIRAVDVWKIKGDLPWCIR
jgi:hypothetical protein